MIWNCFLRNDNGPLFKQSRHHVLVAKNTLPGETIVTVAASDPDVPSPGNGGALDDTFVVRARRAWPLESIYAALKITTFALLIISPFQTWPRCSTASRRRRSSTTAWADKSKAYSRWTPRQEWSLSTRLSGEKTAIPRNHHLLTVICCSDYVGGVFNLVLESMDGMVSDAHKDQTVVRVSATVSGSAFSY